MSSKGEGTFCNLRGDHFKMWGHYDIKGNRRKGVGTVNDIRGDHKGMLWRKIERPGYQESSS